LNVGVYQEEAFNPQKRTSSTSKHENSVFLKVLGVNLVLLDPDRYILDADLDQATQIKEDPYLAPPPLLKINSFTLALIPCN
jgi:hypothetical protein